MVMGYTRMFEWKELKPFIFGHSNKEANKENQSTVVERNIKRKLINMHIKGKITIMIKITMSIILILKLQHMQRCTAQKLKN